MSGNNVAVPPLSREKIRQVANNIKSTLKLDHVDEFPIMDLFEKILPTVLKGYCYEVRDKSEMGENHGLALPNEPLIILRSDVYEGACKGSGRDRFTVAHEIGHVLLHANVALARTRRSVEPKQFELSEWQANTFAGELLGNANVAKESSNIHEFARRCGLSNPAAMVQFEQYRKSGLLK